MNEIIEFAQKLIKMPSVSGNRKEILNVFSQIKNYLSDSIAVIKEYDFEEDENAPVLLVSNKDSMDFNALALVHIDVVPESEDGQYSPEIKDGKLYGRGALDMKTQTAIVVENLKYVIKNDLPLNYGVLIVSDEETASNSIKLFLKHNPEIKIDVLLDVDGGDLKEIIYRYKHPVTVKVYYEGREGHSSRTWDGDNSINGLMDMLKLVSDNFENYNNKKEPDDTWIDTMSITDFKTDFKANNVIPAYSEARISFRLTEKMSFNKLKEILDKSAIESGAKYDFITHSKGLFMDKENPIIHEYKKIAEKEIGREVKLSHMHGATDSRFFSNWPGVKNDTTTIIVHSIDGEGIHGKGENCDIDSALKLSQIQKVFIEKLAS